MGGWIYGFVTYTAATYITVGLVGARGRDVGEATHPVELDVSIGLLHLHSSLAAAHDGGHVAVSYTGTRLAEGPVPKFYVAGGHMWSEAARAVASAGEDQAPLSQVFRDHLWVDQQVHGEAEFDVALSFFNVNVTTGEKTYEHHNCKVGLALHGKAKRSKCGLTSYFEH